GFSQASGTNSALAPWTRKNQASRPAKGGRFLRVTNVGASHMKKISLSRHIMGMTALGVLSVAAQPVQAAVSGNIGVFSKYVLRGVTNDAESDDPALQGGFDYSHDSGFYAGYWGSSLDYNYETGSDTTAATGFEN